MLESQKVRVSLKGHIPAINGAVEADYELCECQEDSGTDQTLIHCGPVNGDDCMPSKYFSNGDFIRIN